ncbi:hypothetical protein [Cellulomonas fimi]|uniref:Uncharacterized protein n=1 Tax=Cellulomonas fimi TaxID=1708 RepID=A0A7Y0LVF4_CELFI|nr:hypothetical protein [Cellulomonas fimi]NMR18666.1 hypothetical protein [Cellulomonas fimi]
MKPSGLDGENALRALNDRVTEHQVSTLKLIKEARALLSSDVAARDAALFGSLTYLHADLVKDLQSTNDIADRTQSRLTMHVAARLTESNVRVARTVRGAVWSLVVVGLAAIAVQAAIFYDLLPDL